MNHYSRTQTWKGIVVLFVLSCVVLSLEEAREYLADRSEHRLQDTT